MCPRADSRPDTMSHSAPPGTRGHSPVADPGRPPRPFLFLLTARPLPRRAQAPPRRSPPPHSPFRRRPHRVRRPRAARSGTRWRGLANSARPGEAQAGPVALLRRAFVNAAAAEREAAPGSARPDSEHPIAAHERSRPRTAGVSTPRSPSAPPPSPPPQPGTALPDCASATPEAFYDSSESERAGPSRPLTAVCLRMRRPTPAGPK